MNVQRAPASMTPKLEPGEALISPFRRWKMGFTLVPDWLLENGLSWLGALIYARLARFAGRQNYCHVKQSTLARSLGIHRNSVRKYLAELEKAKLIRIVRTGCNESSYYFFLAHPWESPAARNGSPDLTPEKPFPESDVQTEAAGRTKFEHPSNINKEKEIKKTNPLQGPPELNDILQEALASGIPRDVAEKFFYDRTSVGWMHKGTPIIDWRASLRAYRLAHAENQVRRRTQSRPKLMKHQAPVDSTAPHPLLAPPIYELYP
jgi:hypothetical protein